MRPSGVHAYTVAPESRADSQPGQKRKAVLLLGLVLGAKTLQPVALQRQRPLEGGQKSTVVHRNDAQSRFQFANLHLGAGEFEINGVVAHG